MSGYNERKTPPMSQTLARPSGRLWPVLIALGGIAALTASSYVAVPMYPVPMTLQTLVVLLLGAVLGPRGGSSAVLAWLALSLMGAPVLAGGSTGPVAFAGPTAGYLLSFPFVAFLAGLLPRNHGIGGHVARLAGFLGLHAVILGAGWAWLAAMIGPKAAFVSGVAPFIVGSLLKSALATAIIAAFPRKVG